VFRAAIAVFMLGSIGCALSGSLYQFVVARIVEGMGGAMMTPVGRLVLVRSVDRRELINAMVWVTLPALIGPLIGPALGGFITTYISWHWIFLINIPIGLIGIVLATIFIEDVRAESPDPFDPIYVMHTSGSTGAAKAIIVPHQGITNRLAWMNDFFGHSGAQVVLKTTRHIFDSAVWQIFWPLINGGVSVIVDVSSLSADSIVRELMRYPVSTLDFVPSVFQSLFPQEGAAALNGSTALEHFSRARRLDPVCSLHHNYWVGTSLAHFIAGRYQKSSDAADVVLNERTNYPRVLSLKAPSCAQIDRIDEGRACVDRLLVVNPQATVATFKAICNAPFRRNPRALKKYLDGLRRCGLPEGVAPH